MDDLRLYGTRVRPIEGFPGYWIGEDGRLWSQKGRWNCGRMDRWIELSVTTRKQKQGGAYRVIEMRMGPGGKLYLRYIHRLVLEAFVGPAPDGMIALHGDSNPSNSRLENLRWGTPAENALDRLLFRDFGTKLTSLDVVCIRHMRAKGIPEKQVAKMFGVGLTTVGLIHRGKTWKHLLNSTRGSEPCPSK